MMGFLLQCEMSPTPHISNSSLLEDFQFWVSPFKFLNCPISWKCLSNKKIIRYTLYYSTLLTLSLPSGVKQINSNFFDIIKDL